MGAHQALTIGYAGAVGRKLLRTDTLYKPNANFGTVYVTRNNATSDYHSLQVQYQRRMSASLSAQASYTWSHSLDTASSDGFFNAPIQQVDPRLDRGSSTFDVRGDPAGSLQSSVFTSRRRCWRGTLAAAVTRAASIRSTRQAAPGPVR